MGPQPEKMAQEIIRAAMTMAIRGCLVSFAQMAPEWLLPTIAAQCGNILGSSVNSDLATQLRLRKLSKEAFDKGIGEAKIASPPPPPPEARLNG